MRLDIQKFADGKVVIETKLDTSGFENGINDMEKDSKISKFIESIQERLSKIGDDFAKIGKKAGKGIKGIATKVAGIGRLVLSYIPKIISGVIKFGAILTASLGVVALLGLAFIAIMQAMEKVGEEHEELATQIQYIVYVIKQGLAPIVEWIANAIATIIQKAINGVLFILALIARLTGNKLPSGKDFAENMKNANKSSSGVAKNAKEINKQLAGFDEMNVLQDNKGGGSAGGGVSAPDIGMIDGAIDQANQKVDNLFAKISEWWESHWLKKKLEEWVENWKTGWDIMTQWWETFKENWLLGWEIIKQWFKDTIDNIKQWFKDTFDNIKQGWETFKNNWLLGVEIIKQSIKNAINGVKEWVSNAKDWIKQKIVDLKDGFVSFFTTTLPNTMKNAMQKVKDTISNIWNNIKALFSAGGKIFDGIKEGIADTFKTLVNKLIDGVNKVIATPLNALNKALNKIHDVEVAGIRPFKNLWSTNPIKIPVIPKLAKGGIINMPGRGTMVGGAIAGEAGREAVLPLTDSQQMELLGEAIGRYITINANITNTMNGRIISRELQKINNENSFAGNR